jgi:formylglycine-generating enzyme required for sulfatase activity
MVAVPGGAFEMGTKGRAAAEPVHRVAVAPFQVDTHEVSVRDYEACVAAGACTAASPYVASCNAGAARASHPINYVEWRQADAYCRYRKKRLLSEEEWEYMARASRRAPYPWGSAPPEGRACWKRSEQDGTCPVGSYPHDVNALGIVDLAGNVAEWTASGRSESYAAPRTHYVRITRGGTFRSTDPREIDVFERRDLPYDEADSTVGIRCAQSID